MGGRRVNGQRPVISLENSRGGLRSSPDILRRARYDCKLLWARNTATPPGEREDLRAAGPAGLELSWN
jgi:hypothetical protein